MGCKFVGELFEGVALSQGCFEGGADVGQQVNGFGDGEGLVVGLVEHVLPVPGDGVALGFEVGDGVGGFEAEDGFEVDGVYGLGRDYVAFGVWFRSVVNSQTAQRGAEAPL